MTIDIPASHGRLEALLEPADGDEIAAAIVCHPHPQHGGTMRNNVVYRIAKALRAAGVTTLRFNFRGVGRSTGAYDEGRGEEEDARAALDFVAGERPGVPLWATGFSFGARVALSIGARDDRVRALLGVGLALTLAEYSFLSSCDKPKAVVQAEDDQFGAAAEVRRVVEAWSEPRALFVVPDATHMFVDRLDEMEAQAAAAIGFLRGSVVS